MSDNVDLMLAATLAVGARRNFTGLFSRVRMEYTPPARLSIEPRMRTGS